MSDETVEVQYEGVCTEISEARGWTAFSISVDGMQYPVKLSTKLPALIEQGRAAGQSRAVWTAKESDGAENPNKPGTRYRNRYLHSVEVGGTAEPVAPRPVTQTASSEPAHQPYAQGDKDRAITRMAVLKAAAEVCASVDFAPGEDVGAEVIALAHRFEVWVNRDIDEVPFG